MSTTSNTPHDSQESTITVTRQVSGTPERAWAAWTDPAELAQWWWPQWPDTTYAVDAREGGEYLITNARIGVGITGRFTTVDRPNLLELTWIWLDGEAETDADSADVGIQPSADATVDTVTVTFTPNGDGTEVTVRHTSTSHRADGGAEQGWNDVMDRLPGHVEG